MQFSKLNIIFKKNFVQIFCKKSAKRLVKNMNFDARNSFCRMCEGSLRVEYLAKQNSLFLFLTRRDFADFHSLDSFKSGFQIYGINSTSIKCGSEKNIIFIFIFGYTFHSTHGSRKIALSSDNITFEYYCIISISLRYRLFCQKFKNSLNHKS